MPNIFNIKSEAIFIRELIENCDKKSVRCVTEDFPVMNCKLSSMLLSYHLLNRWPDTRIAGIGGIAKDKFKEPNISHYWLEIEGIAIDITGDQYNIISASELNNSILKMRPFNSVHVEHKQNSFLYKLFKISYVDHYTKGFPDIDEAFLHNMKIGYAQLLNQ